MGSGASISEVRELTAEELARAATASGRDPGTAPRTKAVFRCGNMRTSPWS